MYFTTYGTPKICCDWSSLLQKVIFDEESPSGEDISFFIAPHEGLDATLMETLADVSGKMDSVMPKERTGEDVPLIILDESAVGTEYERFLPMKKNVDGFLIFFPKKNDFDVLVRNNIHVDWFASTALHPMPMQMIYKKVAQNGGPVEETEIPWEVLSTHPTRPYFKGWDPRTSKACYEFLLFHNAPTKHQFFMIGTVLQGMLDKERICLAGYPNRYGLQCRYGPDFRVPNCVDNIVCAVWDGHTFPLCMAMLFL